MNLVVTIEIDGDWECSGHTLHVPIVYDSAEQFIVDLEEKVQAWIKEGKDHEKAKKKWEKERPRSCKDQVKLEKMLLEWIARRPMFVEDRGNIKVGHVFDVNLFLNYSEGHVFRQPVVRTLEEWFADGVKDNYIN